MTKRKEKKEEEEKVRRRRRRRGNVLQEEYTGVGIYIPFQPERF